MVPLRRALSRAGSAQREPGEHHHDYQPSHNTTGHGPPPPARTGLILLGSIDEGLEHLRVGGRVEIIVLGHGREATAAALDAPRGTREFSATMEPIGARAPINI
jgi:hypothetical protein